MLAPIISFNTSSSANDTIIAAGVTGLGGAFVGVYGYSTASVGTYGSTESDDPHAAGVRGDNLAPGHGGKGVYGFSYRGYGVYGETNDPDYRGVYYSGGLAGSGDKNCVIRTSDGPRLMYSQESPGAWFEDFGIGELIDGRAKIKLDKKFIETVTIDNKNNPLLVFLQPYGPTSQLYIETKTDGFIVRAVGMESGRVKFAYRVVARRKGYEDRYMPLFPAAYGDPYLYPENLKKEGEK